MTTINIENEYEKAILVLALREFVTAKLKQAVHDYEQGNLEQGNDNSETADVASNLANRIQR